MKKIKIGRWGRSFIGVLVVHYAALILDGYVANLVDHVLLFGVFYLTYGDLNEE